jgi:hypothetical protein
MILGENNTPAGVIGVQFLVSVSIVLDVRVSVLCGYCANQHGYFHE